MTTNSGPEYDVLIVGSGIAGLYTGVELLRRGPRGLRVAICEKARRLGGRVHTYKGKVGSRPVQWEAGAGRISDQHLIIQGLLRRYKLHWMPIGGLINFKGDAMDRCLEPNIFESAIPVMIDTLAGLPSEDLARSTIRQLLTRIHGPVATDNYLLRFPYRAEVDIMRADMALELFRGEMRAHEGYGICIEGLTALIEGLGAEFLRRGGVVHEGRALQNLESEGAEAATRCFWQGGEHAPTLARHVVLAIPSVAVAALPALATWPTLKHLRMTPLLRFYGVFPKGGGAGDEKLWYEGGPAGGGRIVTTGPIRYMIPGSAAMGSAQISYTDSQDAEYWMGRIKEHGEAAVGREMVQELREWIDPRIPTPIFVKSHAWTHGVTYWLPGRYNPVEESRAAVRPLPDTLPGVWACGESYSLRQGWMEGAVEHAELMLGQLLRRLDREASAATTAKAKAKKKEHK